MLQFSVKQSDFDVLKQWDYDDDNDLGVDNNHDNNYADDDNDDNVDDDGDDKNDKTADKGGGCTKNGIFHDFSHDAWHNGIFSPFILN